MKRSIILIGFLLICTGCATFSVNYDFAVHDALGNPRVPYTIYVQKTAKGKIVVDIHQGVLDSAETVLKKVRSLNY